MGNIKGNLQNIIIAGLLCIIFVQRSCGDKKIITLPPKHNKFELVKPTEVKTDTIYKDSIVYKDKKVIVTKPVDKKLVQDYLKATDSISKLNLYVAAVEKKQYKHTFSDKYIDITIDAKTTGTLNLIAPTYTLKPRDVEIAKSTVFAMYVGGSTTLELPNIKPEFFVNVGFQNKRGDILLGGLGSNKTIMVGYTFRLINIKK